MNPLLALMAYRLVTVARENPRLTSTIVGDQRLVYDAVNLGFTVQSETTLYLAVVENAAALTCREFVERLTVLQRKALGRKLTLVTKRRGPQSRSAAWLDGTSPATFRCFPPRRR